MSVEEAQDAPNNFLPVSSHTDSVAAPSAFPQGFRLEVTTDVKVSQNLPVIGHVDISHFSHTDKIQLIKTGNLLKFSHNGITVTVTLKGPGE